jgi:D-serine deaminase-like pyridoxal phosphate-dependent protein
MWLILSKVLVAMLVIDHVTCVPRRSQQHAAACSMSELSRQQSAGHCLEAVVSSPEHYGFVISDDGRMACFPDRHAVYNKRKSLGSLDQRVGVYSE